MLSVIGQGIKIWLIEIKTNCCINRYELWSECRRSVPTCSFRGHHHVLQTQQCNNKKLDGQYSSTDSQTDVWLTDWLIVICWWTRVAWTTRLVVLSKKTILCPCACASVPLYVCICGCMYRCIYVCMWIYLSIYEIVLIDGQIDWMDRRLCALNVPWLNNDFFMNAI